MIIACPDCGTENRIPDSPKAGERYRCGKCNARLSEAAHARKQSRSIAPFASTQTLVFWVTVIFTAMVLTGVVAIVLDHAAIGYLHLVLLVPAAIIFLLWIHRAHKNLPALGAQRLEYTPGWAVGWFFVPIFAWFRPFQVVTEIWKASAPAVGHEEDWQEAPTSSLISWWWALWLISNFGIRVATMTFGRSVDISAYTTMTSVLIAGVAIEILGAILAILLVRRIGARQDEKHTQLQGF